MQPGGPRPAAPDAPAALAASAPAGLQFLLDFYRGAHFHPGTDAPRTVAIADPSEYLVAQAVVTAGEVAAVQPMAGRDGAACTRAAARMPRPCSTWV